MTHMNNTNILRLDEDRYLIYQSLLGNVRIVDKKMLMLISNPELADKIENNEVKLYVDLFRKEGYIEALKPGIKNPATQNLLERNVLNIDLSGEYLGSSDEVSLLAVLKDIINRINQNKLYVVIKNGLTPVKYNLFQKIITILSEFNNKTIQLCIQFPIEVFENDRWAYLSLPKDTVLEAHMKGTESELQFLDKLLDLYDKRNVMIRFKNKEVNIVYIEEIFKRIKWSFIAFNLDIEFDYIANPSRIIEEIMAVRELAKQYQVNVHGWWYKPFENLINSTPNCFCNTFEKQISIGLKNDLKCCAQHCVSNIQENYTDFENYIRSLEEKIEQRRKSCSGCKIEGFCRGGCTYWKEQDMNSICNFLIEITERFLVTRYS